MFFSSPVNGFGLCQLIAGRPDTEIGIVYDERHRRWSKGIFLGVEAGGDEAQEQCQERRFHGKGQKKDYNDTIVMRTLANGKPRA
jgi:hypothetical protein